MDLINKYKHDAYRKFEFENTWFNTSTEKLEISNYLENKQKKQSIQYRFYLRDIESVLSDELFNDFPKGFTQRVVLQKSNFDVQKSTINNGYTTRLIFLIKDNYGDENWYIYGYAKGLYNNLSALNVSKSEPLGWSLFISLMEVDKDFSGSISKIEKLKRILKLMRE